MEGTKLLGLTQINIKINQTEAISGKTEKSGEGSGNTFGQVLDAIQNLMQTSPSGEQAPVLSATQESMHTLNGESETPVLLEEEWLELDMVLAEIAAYIEQNPVLSTSMQKEGSQTNPTIKQLVNELEQWTQKLDKGSLVTNQTQLVQDLKQLLIDITSSHNTISIDSAIEQIRAKIQLALEQGFAASGHANEMEPNVDQTNIQANDPTMTKNLETFENIRQPVKLPFLAEGPQNQNLGINQDASGMNNSVQLKDELAPTVQAGTSGQSVPNGSSIPVGTPVTTITRTDLVPGAAAPTPVLPVQEVSEWAGRFIRVSTVQAGSTQARISLYPEHLGHVEIKIMSNEGHVSAQFITETAVAKDALEGQLHQLKQTLQQFGLQVQRLDIIQQSQSPMGNNQTNLSFSSGGSNSSNEQRRSNQKESINMNKKDEDAIPAAYGHAPRKNWSNIDFSA